MQTLMRSLLYFVVFLPPFLIGCKGPLRVCSNNEDCTNALYANHDAPNCIIPNWLALDQGALPGMSDAGFVGEQGPAEAVILTSDYFDETRVERGQGVCTPTLSAEVYADIDFNDLSQYDPTLNISVIYGPPNEVPGDAGIAPLPLVATPYRPVTLQEMREHGAIFEGPIGLQILGHPLAPGLVPLTNEDGILSCRMPFNPEHTRALFEAVVEIDGRTYRPVPAQHIWDGVEVPFPYTLDHDTYYRPIGMVVADEAIIPGGARNVLCVPAQLTTAAPFLGPIHAVMWHNGIKICWFPAHARHIRSCVGIDPRAIAHAREDVFTIFNF